MRSEVFSPLSPPLRLPFPRPISRRAAVLHPRSTPKPQKPSSSGPTARMMIGSPEPPWQVIPPIPPQNPFSDQPRRLFDFQANGSGTEIPFSIRFLQMRKKMLAMNKRPRDAASLGPAGNVVWSLACMLEELQRSVYYEDEEAVIARVSRDTSDSVVYLFQRVFFTSPNLVAELLDLVSKYVVLSAEHAVSRPVIDPVIDVPLLRAECWSDIGILEESDRQMQGSGCADYRRRQIAYEHMIIADKANSLILSNYAQLLYQYEKDLVRAEDYFRLAVNAEPVDGEARSRYATFLWRERGDMEGAEEMFLEAIEVDPENVYHQSSYSRFIWMTGGPDTCFPLDGYGDENDHIENHLSEL